MSGPFRTLIESSRHFPKIISGWKVRKRYLLRKLSLCNQLHKDNALTLGKPTLKCRNSEYFVSLSYCERFIVLKMVHTKPVVCRKTLKGKKNYLGNIGILKYIFKKYDVNIWAGHLFLNTWAAINLHNLWRGLKYQIYSKSVWLPWKCSMEISGVCYNAFILGTSNNKEIYKSKTTFTQ